MRRLIKELASSVSQRYREARTLLSFDEYIEEVRKAPHLHCRNAAQYLLDAFRYFGTEKVETPLGEKVRYKLFRSLGSEKQLPLIGQEEVQEAIVKTLENFIREGKPTRLMLLHGPNGSGKTSIVQLIFRALESYSQTQEGVLYRFNWIFPREKLTRSSIGFARDLKREELDLDSYAHLDGDQIEARLSSPLKDHPLFLLPSKERRAFLQSLKEEGLLPSDFHFSSYILEGDLSPKNRQIFDALLAHYHGDYSELLRHVQIERYYISRRYRVGAVTIEPQMHVDAAVRQITADRSLAVLPKPLTNLNLLEPIGALVDANRGVLEYSDLLKRPVEAFKYLLSTCETGSANVEPVILFFDLILIGTANEQNLDRFKELSEFTSFKSRLELIKVPYILRYSTEKELYDKLLEQANIEKPITPHVTELAALWAVLTRMKKPNPKRLPKEVADLVATFTPLEKAYLYDRGEIPARFNIEESKLIKKHLRSIYEESANDVLYEGRLGASPREIRVVLLNAAQNSDYKTLSPLALFSELEKLVREKTVHLFLQQEPRDGYYDPEEFINIVRKEYLKIIDRELRLATELIKPEEYVKLLNRYIENVKALLRNEKVYNPVTQGYDPPDEKLLENVESILLSPTEEPEEFRNGILSRIAAFSVENPNEKLDIKHLFSDLIQRLEEDALDKHYHRIRKIAQNCLALLNSEKSIIDEEEKREASQTIENFKKYGYTEEGIKEVIALLLKELYANE